MGHRIALALLLWCFSIASLFASGQQGPPTRPTEPKRPGILFAGFGQNEKFLEFNGYIHSELKNHLISRGVLLSDDMTGQSDLSSLLDRLPGSGAQGLVYYRVDANEVGWIWLTVQCFDPRGKLLWEEKSNSLWSGAMTPSGCARAAVNRIQGKLKKHLGKPGLPARDSGGDK